MVVVVKEGANVVDWVARAGTLSFERIMGYILELQIILLLAGAEGPKPLQNNHIEYPYHTHSPHLH